MKQKKERAMETKWYVCQKCGNEEEGIDSWNKPVPSDEQTSWKFIFDSTPDNCSWCGGLDFKLEVEEDGR
jgi:hypothetical protein